MDILQEDVSIEHEATISKVAEDQLFYLMSRGLSEEEATMMVVQGFLEPFTKELPMEYAVETEPPHPAGNGRVGGLNRLTIGAYMGPAAVRPFFCPHEEVKCRNEGRI